MWDTKKLIESSEYVSAVYLLNILNVGWLNDKLYFFPGSQIWVSWNLFSGSKYFLRRRIIMSSIMWAPVFLCKRDGGWVVVSVLICRLSFYDHTFHHHLKHSLPLVFVSSVSLLHFFHENKSLVFSEPLKTWLQSERGDLLVQSPPHINLQTMFPFSVPCDPWLPPPCCVPRSLYLFGSSAWGIFMGLC